MENYSILDLFKDNINEDKYAEILEMIVSMTVDYTINKDISNLDNYVVDNPILNELSKSRGYLCRLSSENLFQDLEKRKIYSLATLNILLFFYNSVKAEIDFKKKNLELLNNKYIKEFIYFLNEKPVVTKTDLCQHLKISESTLNRFLVKIKPYNLYSVRRYNKRNYYYSTPEHFHLYIIINKMEKISAMFQQLK